MTLSEFMYSDDYSYYLDKLDGSLLLMKVDRKPKVPDIVMKTESDALRYANITSDDLKWLITEFELNTIKFIVKKQVTYTEPDGGKDNIVNHPPQINFPIGHLIEFFILLKKPKELMGYLKAIRMPGPKKYASEITNIFNEAMQ